MIVKFRYGADFSALFFLCTLILLSSCTSVETEHIKLDPKRVASLRSENHIVHRHVSIAAPDGWRFTEPTTSEEQAQNVVFVITTPGGDLRGRLAYLPLFHTTNAEFLARLYRSRFDEKPIISNRKIVRIDGRRSFVETYEFEKETNSPFGSEGFVTAYIPAYRGAYIAEFHGPPKEIELKKNEMEDIIYSFKYEESGISARRIDSGISFLSNSDNWKWKSDIEAGILLRGSLTPEEWGETTGDELSCRVAILNGVTKEEAEEKLSLSFEGKIVAHRRLVVQNEAVIAEVETFTGEDGGSGVAYRLLHANRRKGEKQRLIIFDFDHELKEERLIDVYRMPESVTLLKHHLLW